MIYVLRGWYAFGWKAFLLYLNLMYHAPLCIWYFVLNWNQSARLKADLHYLFFFWYICQKNSKYGSTIMSTLLLALHMHVALCYQPSYLTYLCIYGYIGHVNIFTCCRNEMNIFTCCTLIGKFSQIICQSTIFEMKQPKLWQHVYRMAPTNPNN